MHQYLEAGRSRLEQARRIADDLRHDEALHRLAMMAVFVLEDMYEALSRTPPRREATERSTSA